MRPTLRVDLDAIKDNVKAWRAHLGTRPLWAVVKCDGYRMGLFPVATACLEAGAQRLCVVEMAEAMALRDAGITAAIVQIAATPDADIEAGVRNGITLSVADAAHAVAASRYAREQRTTAVLHVAIESGTGWWGVVPEAAAAFARQVSSLDNVRWEGVWTHIAGRDSMAAQLAKLHDGIAELRSTGLAVPEVHIGSTGPVVWGLGEGAARIGVGLYGAAMGDADQAAKLRTALEVRAPVYAVRTFSEPMPLGYGGTYVALPGQTIVTLRIGYGEGLPKTLAGRGCFRLAGVACPIVGAIGMNFTMVAVPPNVDIGPKDEAIVVGDAPGVRLEEVAAAAQTIPHNILTMFGAGLTPSYVATDLQVRASARRM